MPDIPDLLKSWAMYIFIVVGVLWGVLGVEGGSSLVLWPAVTLIVGGLLMKLRPSDRITWAWATSAAFMGFLVSGYQAYYWSPLIGGAFTSVAATAFAVFFIFALAHILLVYLGATATTQVR
jgi:heme/copper-type cytochrome/quinol oxidase subunit 3